MATTVNRLWSVVSCRAAAFFVRTEAARRATTVHRFWSVESCRAAALPVRVEAARRQAAALPVRVEAARGPLAGTHRRDEVGHVQRHNGDQVHEAAP